MRPRSLDDFVGQEHFLGPGKLLRRMLDAERLGSLVFYGPPGSGKTALAHVIANQTQCRFRSLNATSSGTKEVRDLLREAAEELETTGRRTILFLDELHRFNKAQQDVLLPDVEAGTILLIGATTQNPFFAINAPLLSRSTIFTFEPLSREHVKALLKRALADTERGLGNIPVEADEAALDFLAEVSDGDARRALTALEVGVLSSLPSPPRGKGRKNDPFHPRRRPGLDPAQGPRLRPDRRHPLRRRQRLHQEHARQRPGRGHLLAGPHARVRRGPTVHRPPRGNLRLRGRGQRRPASAGRRRRRLAGH
jgi:putative ATPase